MKKIIRIAGPVFISQLALTLNGLIDTLMAGSLSALDLAAVGIGSSIFGAVFVTSTGMLMALTPTVAHLYGAKRHADIGEEIRQASWLGMLLTLLVVTLLLHPQIFLTISQLDGVMEAKVRAYLAVLAWSGPASMAMRLFGSFVSGIGRPRPLMVLSMLSLLLKVPLNTLFMFGSPALGIAAMGAAGCGMSTAILAWSGLLCALGWAMWNKHYAPYQLFARWHKPNFKILGELLKLGLPMGLTFLVDVTAFTFMALFVARLGPLISGAHQIATNLTIMCFMLPTAVGHAGSVLCGQSLGAGNPLEARRIGKRALLLGMCCSALLFLVLTGLSKPLATFYTADPAVRAIAGPLIVLVGIYHLADGLQTVMVNLLRGYKKATAPMLIYAVALWGVGLAGGYALGLTDTFGTAMGVAGFWIAATLSLLIVGVLLLAYWLSVSKIVIEESMLRRTI